MPTTAPLIPGIRAARTPPRARGRAFEVMAERRFALRVITERLTRVTVPASVVGGRLELTVTGSPQAELPKRIRLGACGTAPN